MIDWEKERYLEDFNLSPTKPTRIAVLVITDGVPRLELDV